MRTIALELDKKLQGLDAETAASVERLVRDALSLAEKTKMRPTALPPNFWEQIRAEWGNGSFERPPQGGFESREEW